jgi:uncharacterized protein
VVDPRVLLTTALTLAISAVGGTVFTFLAIPAGWLTGGMVAVAVAAMAGVSTEMPNRLRNVAFVVLGSSLGAGVSPELIAHLADWPLSLAGLAVTVLAVQAVCQLFLDRVCGWDRQTAFFSAIPGVTSYVLALALPTKADIRRIALSQTIRVFLLVALLPTLLTAVESVAPAPAHAIGSYQSLAVTLAAGTIGGILLHSVGIPAAPMIGAMVASGILHGTGLVHGAFPQPLLVVVYIVLGGLIGSRFVGTTFAMLRQTALASLGAFVLAITVAALGAWLMSATLGQPFGQLALAYAPGGIDVMTAMSVALSLDSAFVAAHQLARFLVIMIYAPLLGRRFAGKGSAAVTVVELEEGED